MQVLETTTLRVSEIFFSLQGETSRIGLPTVFIRLTGCPLRCSYCDTAYAFTGGGSISISTILDQLAHYQSKYVTVTGGEPLAQKACLVLLTALCEAQYSVSLETSGALELSEVDSRVCKVMDIKTPGSGVVAKNLWSNLIHLLPHNQIKFVICNYADYEWAKQKMIDHQLIQYCQLLFSPSYQQIDARELADWIIRDRLQVRLQIQLHKYLWGDVPGK